LADVITCYRGEMAVTEGAIRRVWIEPGCIACGWCTDLVPAIFIVGEGKACVIAAAARKDGSRGANRREKSPLKRMLTRADAEFLCFVADGCPAKVIKLDA